MFGKGSVGCWLCRLLQMLSLFDSDLDFKNNRVRLWQPGTVAQLAASEGLVEVPAAVLNESGGTMSCTKPLPAGVLHAHPSWR